MRCVDVNVLVYAHRPEAPDHDRYRAWLDDARTSHEPLGVNDLVLSGFLRIVTHPRVFRDPSPLETALEFAEALRTAPRALPLAPGRRHWGIFVRLCRSTEVRGNLVPDAFLAAVAIERGATWYSADRSFARFAELRWRHPLEER
ncbi:type II toxin-antitoxin system VapC family toxin [soil metagenome]